MNIFTDLPLEEKASESAIVGMSQVVMEERAPTSADVASQLTSGMKVTMTRGTLPSVTEKRQTSSADTSAQSASGDFT